MHRLLIIVPAFNEEENLGLTIASLREHQPAADIIVINDGSTDETSNVARSRDALVVDLPFNVGIGAAVQCGFIYAFRHGYDLAMQVDGDGQHPASQTGALVDRMIEGDCDVVIGSRFVARTAYRGSLARRIGIAILSVINSILLGRRISDTTSGFRLVNRRAITFLAADYPHDFPEPESIITLMRSGFRVVEVPVEMVSRQGGRSSITFLRSFFYMTKVLVAILVGATRRNRRNIDASEHSNHLDPHQRPDHSSRGASDPGSKAT